MRTFLAAMLACLAFDAIAQSGARARPPGTVPLDAPASPPPLITVEPALEPEVTTRMEGDRKVEEYRMGGKLYMQRVTPRNGQPYLLIDHRGDGTFTRQDNTLDPGVRVPQWVLLEF